MKIVLLKSKSLVTSTGQATDAMTWNISNHYPSIKVDHSEGLTNQNESEEMASNHLNSCNS